MKTLNKLTWIAAGMLTIATILVYGAVYALDAESVKKDTPVVEPEVKTVTVTETVYQPLPVVPETCFITDDSYLICKIAN